MSLPDPPIPPGLPDPPTTGRRGGYRRPERRPWFRFGPADTHRGATSVAWFAVGGLLALTTLVWGTLQTVGVLAHDERPLRPQRLEAAAGDELVVRSAGGRIDLVVGAEGQVVVSGTVSEGLVPTDVTITDDRRGVRVDVSCSWASGPWCGADLRIEVPPSLAVDAQIDHGRLTAAGLAGDLRLRSDTGSIRATALRSQVVDATSDAGEVQLRFAAAPRRVVAVADVRGVVVVVPDDDASYRVDATSEGGEARVAVRTDPLATRTISVTSDASDAVVRYAEAPG